MIEKAVFSLNAGKDLYCLLKKAVPFPYERIYIGTEICERLLLGVEDLASYLYNASDARVKVTLTTPPHMSDSGLETLDKQLDIIDKLGVVDEIVFNDWGALELICNRKYLQPVLGRALHRMKRDPRIGTKELSEAELTVLRSSNITNKIWLNYLRSRGIDRIECDNVPQGIEIDFKKLSLHATIYYPIIPITFSRNCFVSATHRSSKSRFAINGPCHMECLSYSFFIENLNVAIIGKNTYMQNETLEKINLGQFDRIVRVLP